ncbi:MAG: hypothetical protein ACRDGD_09515, partial [Candidatus Limnocylindria bacterium]
LHETSRGFDDPQYRTLGIYGIVVTEIMRGRLREAITLADEMMENGLAGVEGSVYGGRAATWSGDTSTARRMRDVLGEAPAGRRTDAMLATLDGGIAALEGRAADARAHYAEAQRIARDIGTPYWLGMTNLDIVITGAMEADERRRAADEAREIFTRLRANALLDRLDAALAIGAPAAASRAPAVEAEAEVPQQA